MPSYVRAGIRKCARIRALSVAAVLIALFAIAQWLLTPLVDGAARMMFYFWYPISPDWSDIVICQVIPCFGFCSLLIMACIVAFNSRDRLKN